MEIAVCLSGAERLESEALTLFARKLPKDAEVDCFGFFWEGGPLSEEKALEKLIAVKSEGRFRRTEVVVGRNFKLDFELKAPKYSETNVENTIRMFRGIKACNALKLRHEVERGAAYDYVVRCRADVYVSSPLDFGRFMPLTREFVVFPENGHWRGGLNDQFAFSSSQNMDVYASLIDYLNEHLANGCIFHPETLLRFHLMKMQLLPLIAPLSSAILRA